VGGLDALDFVLRDYLAYKGELPEWDSELMTVANDVMLLMLKHADGGAHDWIADQLKLDEERVHCAIQKLCEEGKTFIYTEPAQHGRNGRWRLTAEGWLEAVRLAECGIAPQP
jgi:hypothetical protein